MLVMEGHRADVGEDDAFAELARVEHRLLIGSDRGAVAGIPGGLAAVGYLFDDSLRFQVGFSVGA